MENLKARFMLLLCEKTLIPTSDEWTQRGWPDWQLAQAQAIAEMSALADKLAAACTPASDFEGESARALDERDHGVLAALVEMMPSYQRGALSSHWKALCEHKGICARRGWETSSQRLLAAGKVRLVGGKRWFVEVANTPAI